MNIGIVNDSMIIAEALRRVVTATLEHHVVWVAHSGAEALSKCEELRPDLVLMDLIMPHMDGIETTRQIMQDFPCAILIVTASPTEHVDQVFRALGAGALDVTAVPNVEQGDFHGERLLAKIKMIGKLIQADKKVSRRNEKKETVHTTPQRRTGIQTLVAIGASTGGPLAISRLLSSLVIPSSACIVVVQHIDQRFADTFAGWLADQIQSPVRVVEDESTLIPGHVHIAKTNDHLVLNENARLGYSQTPREYPYRPSVDVFFHCIAEHWRHHAIGVLLTGMGRDGAEGLLAMRQAGMLTIAQDRSTSAVYGMPRAALEINAAEKILPLPEIAATLHEHLQDDERSA